MENNTAPTTDPANIDKEIAILIHQNHDAVIASMKSDQWRIFAWTHATALLLLAASRAHHRYIGDWLAILLFLLVIALGAALVLWIQFKLRSRRNELAFVQRKMGTAYTSLRKKGANEKLSWHYGIQVWGFQIVMLLLTLVGGLIFLARIYY